MIIDYKKLYKKYKTKYKNLDENPCKIKKNRDQETFEKIINYHNEWWKSFMNEEEYEYRKNNYFKLEKYELHKYNRFYEKLTQDKLHYTDDEMRGDLDNLREKMLNYKKQINDLYKYENYKKELNYMEKILRNIYNNYPNKIYEKLESLNIQPLNIRINDIKWDYNKQEIKKCKQNEKNYDKNELKIKIIEIMHNIEKLELIIEFTLNEFDLLQDIMKETN